LNLKLKKLPTKYLQPSTMPQPHYLASPTSQDLLFFRLKMYNLETVLQAFLHFFLIVN